MTVVRYLDALLVLATAPFVVAAGLPVFGYLVAACAWLLTRVAAEALHARALRSRDPRVRAGLAVGVMMGRVWLIVLAVLLARYAGGKDDGVMAAVLVLAAFTVYFMMTLLGRGWRDLERKPSVS
jgi:ABC-type xylose transport system permease subunit